MNTIYTTSKRNSNPAQEPKFSDEQKHLVAKGFHRTIFEPSPRADPLPLPHFALPTTSHLDFTKAQTLGK